MNLAVITARGGSKRIPRKNIRPFCGKPIIAYSIEAALQSKCFDRVIVSTDDAEIAGVAKSFGAEVPFVRPAALSDDYAGTDAVFRHAVETIAAEGKPIEYACCIYPTCPLLQPELLAEGLSMLRGGFQSVFAAMAFDFPIQQALAIKDGQVRILDPAAMNARSQDLEDRYHDAGMFYWVDVKTFLALGTTFSGKLGAVIVPAIRAQDINTEEDWLLAEGKFELLNAGKR
ncbi:MAG: pseudaminic acid cytidylyltransferase [Rhodospirillaceae bacterium]|nr:pseudaminic acid cytidylyltransferase [Rhodospirillaceae bacterium]